METFNTKYGSITLYSNETYITPEFKKGEYWDESTLQQLRGMINPNRDILEIGGHCGTSTLVYASYLKGDSKVHVYEPQKNMYNLLCKNIKQNNLSERIIPYNKGVFCYSGSGRMRETDIDGGGGQVSLRYNEEIDKKCNFGGIGLGNDGEAIELTTIDEMGLDNIGFIHCDAQGAENFIFSGGMDLLRKCRPVIYYENNSEYGKYLYNSVCNSYPQYSKESRFDVKNYCLNSLGYRFYIDKFNKSIDTLLIP